MQPVTNDLQSDIVSVSDVMDLILDRLDSDGVRQLTSVSTQFNLLIHQVIV